MTKNLSNSIKNRRKLIKRNRMFSGMIRSRALRSKQYHLLRKHTTQFRQIILPSTDNIYPIHKNDIKYTHSIINNTNVMALRSMDLVNASIKKHNSNIKSNHMFTVLHDINLSISLYDWEMAMNIMARQMKHYNRISLYKTIYKELAISDYEYYQMSIVYKMKNT